MDPIVEFLWWSKEYSTPIEEIVLLLGKFVGMQDHLKGVRTPDFWVGQMILEAPP